ncbi:hypothetical protein GCM10028895_54060 [Pontibacter rugosus]
MEESSEIKKLYSFLQGLIYFTIVVEVAVFLFMDSGSMYQQPVLRKVKRMAIYEHIYFSKAFTFGLILIVSIGTKARKNLDLDPLRHIFLPLLIGCAFFFGSGLFYFIESSRILFWDVSLSDAAYILLSFLGAMMIHIALDNISKHIQHRLMKDKFNVENESFEQSRKPVHTPHSVNIPMLYYYQKRVQRGWLNVVNPFRATLLIGTPGSGKSFSVVLPFIKQLLGKGFSMMVYDFKFPDLARTTYYHYLVNRKRGILKNHRFHVINFNSVEHSRRFNPLKPEYLPTLADATETAEALLEALRKGDRDSGTAQFFNQSAVNFLASCIYFLSRHEGGGILLFRMYFPSLTLAMIRFSRCSFPNLSWRVCFRLLPQPIRTEPLSSWKGRLAP